MQVKVLHAGQSRVSSTKVFNTDFTECLSDASYQGKRDSQEHGEYLAESMVDTDQLLYRRRTTLARRKRNILFASGVKLCTQETLDQAIANHLSYFHLRGMWMFPGFISVYWTGLSVDKVFASCQVFFSLLVLSEVFHFSL